MIADEMLLSGMTSKLDKLSFSRSYPVTERLFIRFREQKSLFS
jgi:hypothetical protein